MCARFPIQTNQMAARAALPEKNGSEETYLDGPVNNQTFAAQIAA